MALNMLAVNSDFRIVVMLACLAMFSLMAGQA